MLTSVGVEHDTVEKMVCCLGDEFMGFENIGEVIFVHFVWVPFESETTTNEWLISIESNDGVVISDIIWSGEKVHLSVNFDISLGTIIWESITTWTTESTLSLVIAIDWSREDVDSVITTLLMVFKIEVTDELEFNGSCWWKFDFPHAWNVWVIILDIDFTRESSEGLDTVGFAVWMVRVAHANWVVKKETVTFAGAHWDTTVLTSFLWYIIPVFVFMRLKWCQMIKSSKWGQIKFWLLTVKISNLFPEATAAAMTALKSFILIYFYGLLAFDFELKIQTEYFSCESGCFFPSINRVLYHSSNARGSFIFGRSRRLLYNEDEDNNDGNNDRSGRSMILIWITMYWCKWYRLTWPRPFSPFHNLEAWVILD